MKHLIYLTICVFNCIHPTCYTFYLTVLRVETVAWCINSHCTKFWELSSTVVWYFHLFMNVACVHPNKLWKILKEMGISEYLTWLLRSLYAGQEATVRTGHGTTHWSKFGKEYVKAVYCHPAYLTYKQSKSWEMPGWMKHKLKSRLPGEISITSDIQMTPPLWEKAKRN